MDLYISGILYAKFDPFVNNSEVSLLNIGTAEMLPPGKAKKETIESLSSLSHMNLVGLPALLQEAASHISAGCDSFVMSDGSVYERKDTCHYIQRNRMFPADLVVSDGHIRGVMTASRDSIAILIEPGFEHLTVLPQWRELYPDAIYPVADPFTVMVPMRDGVQLAMSVMLPIGKALPVPCVLVRTPYGRQHESESWIRFAQRGFAVAVQDTRGRNDSEGEFKPLTCEIEDGSDTLDFLAAQDWCNGQIGTIGGSYLGYVQWAMAASGNKNLKAMVSEVTAGSAFIDMPRRGGTLSSGMMAWAFLVSEKKMDESKMLRDDWDEVLAARPLEDVPRKALGYDIPFWRDWFDHYNDDAYWDAGNWYRKIVARGGIDIPVLIETGWFDDNGMGSTQALDVTADYPHGLRKVIMGPWIHCGNSAYDLHRVALGQNALRYDLDLWYYRWMEKHLCNKDCIPADTAPIEYYTVGSDCWKTAEHWPPETAGEYVLSLSAGKALCAENVQPGVDSFVYDPANPATHIIDMSENEIEVPEDYTEEEKRSDFLLYTTAPMEEDFTFTGDAKVCMYISSDCPDTDIMVRINRVTPDGRSVKLADGILDVKYREGFDKEVFMEAGQIYPIEIRTTKFSVCFKKGEQLRLSVTSGALNFCFPNSNTKDSFNSTDIRVATNSIHYGGAYPSRILLKRER